jgi:hypothetical protein
MRRTVLRYRASVHQSRTLLRKAHQDSGVRSGRSASWTPTEGPLQQSAHTIEATEPVALRS